jgi:hypothetical protein
MVPLKFLGSVHFSFLLTLTGGMLINDRYVLTGKNHFPSVSSEKKTDINHLILSFSTYSRPLRQGIYVVHDQSDFW